MVTAQMHRKISRQENITYSSPDGLPPDSLPFAPKSIRAYADVTTKICRLDSLPNFLSYWAPRARAYACAGSSAIMRYSRYHEYNRLRVLKYSVYQVYHPIMHFDYIFHLILDKHSLLMSVLSHEATPQNT